MSLRRVRTPVRLALVLAAGAAFVAVRAPDVSAHLHDREHKSWAGGHPVYDHNEAPSREPWRDITFVVRPIRVDLDETAPGRYGVRSVRLRVRGLQRPLEEQTIAWEETLFASEAAMVGFKRALEPLLKKPILSMRVRVIEDTEAPAHNKRWRATELPIWAETPFLP
jgi:hypothetical protein